MVQDTSKEIVDIFYMSKNKRNLSEVDADF